jgi:hypothetical protein
VWYGLGARRALLARQPALLARLPALLAHSGRGRKLPLLQRLEPPAHGARLSSQGSQQPLAGPSCARLPACSPPRLPTPARRAPPAEFVRYALSRAWLGVPPPAHLRGHNTAALFEQHYKGFRQSTSKRLRYYKAHLANPGGLSQLQVGSSAGCAPAAAVLPVGRPLTAS